MTQPEKTPFPLSQCLASVDSAEGRQRLAEYLNSTPFPHYEAVADKPELLVRVDADGTRTVGHFVGREFRPVDTVAQPGDRPDTQS